jgi:F420-0:gamma-glutamyl ligase
MHIRPIKIKKLSAPKDDLFAALDAARFSVFEKDILVIASKVVAIHQGRTVKNDGTVDKEQLIMQEAEKYIPRHKVPNGYALHTIKNHTIIGSAGVDESNGNGYFILWPEKLRDFTRTLHAYFCQRFHVKQLGVIVADSHSVPMRRGAIGIGIGFYGLYPFKEYAGEKDLFDRDFKVELSNVIDGVAAAGVVAMGEGSEQTPLAVVRGVEGCQFITQDFYDHWAVDEEEDVYREMLKVFQKTEEQ